MRSATEHRVCIVMLGLFATGLPAAGAPAGTTAAVVAPVSSSEPVPPHPLVRAATAVCTSKLLEGRVKMKSLDKLVALASEEPGLTDSDRARLQAFSGVARAGANDPAGARRAFTEALKLDREVSLPPCGPASSRRLFEDRRALVPAGAQAPAGARDEATRKAITERKPVVGLLLAASDGLWAEDVSAALLVAELAGPEALTNQDRARVAAQVGTLQMESGEEVQARATFGEALNLDRNARLPSYAPTRAQQLFDGVRSELPPPPPPLPVVRPAPPPAPPPRTPSSPGLAIELHAGWSGKGSAGTLLNGTSPLLRSGMAFHLAMEVPLNDSFGLSLGAGYGVRGSAFSLSDGVTTILVDEAVSHLRLPLGVLARLPLENDVGLLRLRVLAGLSPELVVGYAGTFTTNGSAAPLTSGGWFDGHGGGNVAIFLGGGAEAGLGHRPSWMLGVEVVGDVHLGEEWSGTAFSDGSNARYFNINVDAYVKYVF